MRNRVKKLISPIGEFFNPKTDKKRRFDIATAGAAMVTLAPVMAILYPLVKADMHGKPALLKQIRGGKHGQPFTILKFKTMRDFKDAAEKVSDAERITKIGRFLQKISLDELPQFYNVWIGEMSIVGPRPKIHNPHSLLKTDVYISGEYQSICGKSLDAKPGMISPWQVKRIQQQQELPLVEIMTLERDYALSAPNLTRDFGLILGVVPILWKGSSKKIATTPISQEAIDAHIHAIPDTGGKTKTEKATKKESPPAFSR